MQIIFPPSKCISRTWKVAWKRMHTNTLPLDRGRRLEILSLLRKRYLLCYLKHTVTPIESTQLWTSFETYEWRQPRLSILLDSSHSNHNRPSFSPNSPSHTSATSYPFILCHAFCHAHSCVLRCMLGHPPRAIFQAFHAFSPSGMAHHMPHDSWSLIQHWSMRCLAAGGSILCKISQLSRLYSMGGFAWVWRWLSMTKTPYHEPVGMAMTFNEGKENRSNGTAATPGYGSTVANILCHIVSLIRNTE